MVEKMLRVGAQGQPVSRGMDFERTRNAFATEGADGLGDNRGKPFWSIQQSGPPLAAVLKVQGDSRQKT